MGLFRSKSETYREPEAVADIERGLVARYLARLFERGDLPLRGLLSILRWLNERGLTPPVIDFIAAARSGALE